MNRAGISSQRCQILAVPPCTGTVIKKTMDAVFSALIPISVTGSGAGQRSPEMVYRQIHWLFTPSGNKT
jgi:hypothetical protein